MSPGVLRSWLCRRLGGVALACFLVLYLSWQALRWIPVRQQIAGDGFIVVLSLSAVWFAHRASRRTAGSPRLALAWRWVSLALVGQAAGEVAQLVYEALRTPAYGTLADPLYLTFYPLLLLGIIAFPTARRTTHQTLELVLDIGIITLGWCAAYVFVILDSNVPTATPVQAIAAVGYPLGSMILVIALAFALLREPLAETRRNLQLIGLAAALFVAADLIFGYVVRHGGYRGGDPVDILYVLALACFIVAASRQPPVDRVSDPTPAVHGTNTGTAWLPYLAMTVILASLLVSQGSQPLFPQASITFIVVLSGTMVVMRQLLHQRALRQERERLAQAQEIAQVGSWEWDVEHDVIRHSEEDLRLYGADQHTAPISRTEALAVVHPDDRERVEQVLTSALAGAKPFTYEMRIVGRDGEVRTLLTRGDVEMHAGRVTRVRGTHQDITDRKQMEAQLRYEAQHDPLTGLYNRGKFAEELERALRYAARYNRHGALLILDVDDFKLVNDSLGHAAGDELLNTLALVILERMRASDVVARLGGDEFAVVLPEVDEAQALGVAEEIRAGLAAREVRPPVKLSGAVVTFHARHDMVADDALIAADIALYEAKESGKDQVHVYRGSSGAAVTWVERTRAALADGRLLLYGQPILDLRSGEVAHHELLLRMISPGGEIILPGAFLPTAERFGLINEIDRWVTREGLRMAREGQGVSVNLSARSIGDAHILAQLRQAISSGLHPTDVIFEITETAAMQNMQVAREFAESLVALGCDVALDDFGTGFGSFTYLKFLPARYLKIDVEFVRDIVSSETDRQVVNSITRVAHSLGKLTIAEGVEDSATLQALRGYGVDYAQGFFIGKPASTFQVAGLPVTDRRPPEPAGTTGHRP